MKFSYSRLLGSLPREDSIATRAEAASHSFLADKPADKAPGF